MGRIDIFYFERRREIMNFNTCTPLSFFPHQSRNLKINLFILFCYKLFTTNSCYLLTDFDQDGKTDSISFMIKRIKVHSADALNESSYRFPGNYGVEKFLELFSGKFPSTCLISTNKITVFLVCRGGLRRFLPRLHVHVPRL